MLGFLFGSSKVNEDLEALLKSIEEIEKEIEEEKSSLPEIVTVRDSRSACSEPFFQGPAGSGLLIPTYS